jgi:hypothetical protein
MNTIVSNISCQQKNYKLFNINSKSVNICHKDINNYFNILTVKTKNSEISLKYNNLVKILDVKGIFHTVTFLGTFSGTFSPPKIFANMQKFVERNNEILKSDGEKFTGASGQATGILIHMSEKMCKTNFLHKNSIDLDFKYYCTDEDLVRLSKGMIKSKRTFIRERKKLIKCGILTVTKEQPRTKYGYPNNKYTYSINVALLKEYGLTKNHFYNYARVKSSRIRKAYNASGIEQKKNNTLKINGLNRLTEFYDDSLKQNLIKRKKNVTTKYSLNIVYNNNRFKNFLNDENKRRKRISFDKVYYNNKEYKTFLIEKDRRIEQFLLQFVTAEQEEGEERNRRIGNHRDLIEERKTLKLSKNLTTQLLKDSSILLYSNASKKLGITKPPESSLLTSIPRHKLPCRQRVYTPGFKFRPYAGI